LIVCHLLCLLLIDSQISKSRDVTAGSFDEKDVFIFCYLFIESKYKSLHHNGNAFALIDNQLIKSTVPTGVVPYPCSRRLGDWNIHKASDF
jgi:hypothetical protein